MGAPRNATEASRSARRVFLGWDRALLPAAAAELVARFGTDLAQLVVALPGGRALRRFEAHLAEEFGRQPMQSARAAVSPARAPPTPPRLVTFGRLVDELCEAEHPPASHLLRTLLWAQTLAALPAGTLLQLRRHPPAPGAGAAWLALADELRSLHAELAAHGLDFAAVAPHAAALGGPGEALRWEALAEVQTAWRAALAARGWQDPHEARWAAVAARRWRPELAAATVVLIGGAELNGLTRELLRALGERATLFLFAPESAAADFDEHGAVVPAAWVERELSLPDEAWQLVDRPADQARAAVAWLVQRSRELSGRGEPLAPEEVVIGVPQAEVIAPLERGLAEVDTAVRDARGTPLTATAPVKVLAAVARCLEAPDFGALAALVRQPDAERTLLAQPGLREVLAFAAEQAATAQRRPEWRAAGLAEVLDIWQSSHLVQTWPTPAGWPGGDAGVALAAALHAACVEWLGELAPSSGDSARAARSWAAPLRRLLAVTHWTGPAGSESPGEPLQLDERDESERLLAAALAQLGAALEEFAALPADAGPALSAAAAVRLLLRSVSGASVPPPAEQRAVELLGWLELPLDDARALVVTGFSEGSVPASLKGHAFLPDALRARLGLPHDRSRLARDAYVLSLLISVPRELLVVSGRRAAGGDPLRPSRLLFHAEEEVVLRRAQRLAKGESAPAATERAAALEACPAPVPRPLPRRLPLQSVTRVSVTGFGLYLRSPYRFYLERVLRLERAGDDAHELDPLAFGSLAHAALESLATASPAESGDARKLTAILHAALAARAREQFGERPAPAVRLQLLQLGLRLQRFAEWQAEQHRQGWRIALVECAPDAGVPLAVAGGELRLTGRIDRIDVHPASGAWRIADYKTSEQAQKPDRTHGGTRGRPWKDLQLPLYELLAAPLAPELERAGANLASRPQLGYLVLPARPPEEGPWLAGTWTEDEREAAHARAVSIGADILAGRFFGPGDFDHRDEVFAAIAGQGLLAGTDADADEDGEGEGDGHGGAEP